PRPPRPGSPPAIPGQAAKPVHPPNLHDRPALVALARTLCKRSGMAQAFFCNSGTESIEAAIKIARKVGHGRGIRQPKILVTEGAFHGRTMGALAATHSRKYQEGFTPMLPGFVRVPYNDVRAVEAAFKQHKDIIAILVEPAHGEGGVRLPDADYLTRLDRKSTRLNS